MKKLFNILFSLLAVAFLSVSCNSASSSSSLLSASEQFDADKYEERFNFFIVADGGRNGFYEQKNVADQMGVIAEIVEPEFIVSAGDTHHFDGIESINDPLWTTNFEEIYAHPELMISWYPVLGNHEYRGDTQAVIDYSKVSRRWDMQDRYYTKVIEEAGTTMRLVFVDTTPLIDKYHTEEGYPDAPSQDMEAQLTWIDSVLNAATEDWVVVVGHHPIYAYTTKSIKERINMQDRLDVIMRKYDVDMYICGHIHSFQHLRAEGSGIDYIVNGSASLGRKVEPIEQTQFCSGVEGFLVMSASSENLEAIMVDCKGQEIYKVDRKK